MKMVDINKLFTEKVTEYLNNGYTLCPQSMSGHQGEIGKVDLVKGDELIRVWLDNESSHNWSDDDAWHDSIVLFRVSRWIHPVKNIIPDMTVWMSDLKHIEEYKFYQITRWSGEWYVDSLEEALRIQEIRRIRYHNKSSINRSINLNDEQAKDIASRYMKRKQGYQRVNRDSLSIRVNIVGDKKVRSICYKDKQYKLN